MRERDEVIQVIGRSIVIRIEIGSGIGIEIETQTVKGLGSVMLEVIEMVEGGWTLGWEIEEMEAGTGTVIGAGLAPQLRTATEGLEIQSAHIVEFHDRYQNLNLKEVDLNIPRLT